jgi:hypothetical protein
MMCRLNSADLQDVNNNIQKTWVLDYDTIYQFRQNLHYPVSTALIYKNDSVWDARLLLQITVNPIFN